MKKSLKVIMCSVMCIMIIFSCSALIMAASVGKVNSVTVSSVAANKVTLSWEKVSRATGYRIYRYSSKGKKYVYIGKTNRRTYTDLSVTAGKSYSYKVRAYKASTGKNSYGEYSNAVEAVTNPRKVYNLKVNSVTSTSATLSWSESKGATGYQLYIYDYNDKEYKASATTASTKYTVNNLLPGTRYRYKVAAYHNISGTSYGLKSAAVTFNTNLDAVSSLDVTNITNNSYTLEWTPVAGATGYQVTRYNAEKQSWVVVKTVTGTTFDVSYVTPGSVTQFKVRAINTSNGTVYGGYSPTVSATTLTGAPGSLTATTDNQKITLTWQATAVANGYEVYRYNSPTDTWTTIATTTNTTYTDASVSETAIYTYRVRAYVEYDGVKGYGEYSEIASVFFESSSEPDGVYDGALSSSGLLGYLYDPDENCFYTSSDPWQRNFGYNKLYDTFAPAAFITFDTVRLKFDYGDKNWMIQVWKGQYGAVFYGGEIGVYTKPKKRLVNHYDCANDSEKLRMSMDFYEYEKRLIGKDGWEKKFSRPYGSYWWCTGFIPGNKIGRFDDLRVDSRITMKDYTMLTAFKQALDNSSLSYTVNGLNVYFTYQ